MIGMVIVSSLCIVDAVCQEAKLISELNTFFNFDHNILFHSSANINEFINASREFYSKPQNVYVFKNVDENITNRSPSN